MSRINIKLNSEINQRVRQEAKRKGVTMTSIIIFALYEYFDSQERKALKTAN